MTITKTQVDRAVNPSRISVYNTATHNQTLTLADTWYQLTPTLSDGNAIDFTLRGSPDYDILHEGADGEYLFVGDADFEVDGAGVTVEFGLFVNGVEQTKFTAITEFPASAEIKSFGSSGFLYLDENDVVDIRAKASSAGRQLTVENMKVTFKYVGPQAV